MNYFDCAYLMKKNSPYRSYQIYEVVYSNDMVNYAKKIYGANFSDALDKAYRHILENYDEEKGSLEHYVISIIHNINFNTNKKEFSYDEVTSLAMDDKAFKGNNGDPFAEIIGMIDRNKITDVDKCIGYLLEKYIADFKYFKSKKQSDRLLDYNELFERFNPGVIITALETISAEYDSDIEELYKLRRQMKFKGYPSTRYEDSFDDTVEYMCVFNNIVVYKPLKESHSRVVYELRVDNLLKKFEKEFYTGRLNRVIGGRNCYITLSGRLFFSKGEAMECIEDELVGSFLSRMQQINVMYYKRGSKMLLTTKAPVTRLSTTLLIKEVKFSIEMKFVVSKEARLVVGG